ncbi:MAG: Crp/Fnr family transcriptional regulator [Acidithiobacillus sp.]
MIEWLHHFPALETLEHSAQKQLLANTQKTRWDMGHSLFHTGAPCNQYLLVLSGHIKVQQISPEGREIVLYRIGPGEACMLTTVCLLTRRPYPAMGITESPVEAIIWPQKIFHQFLDTSPIFRQFVFNAFGERLIDMFALIEEVVFTRLDVRLARKLLELSENKQTIRCTHQVLATELGSAREVITRTLKEFELRGWLQRGSGQILILDTPALRKLASPA